MANGDVVVRTVRTNVGKDIDTDLVIEIAAAFPPATFEIIGVHPLNETGGSEVIKANYLIVARDIT